LLLIFAAALSPVLVIGGIRWSGDVERDTERRRETMTLVAQEAASRAEYVLASAPAILSIISAAAPDDPCASRLREVIDSLPELANLGIVDADGKVLCTTQTGGKGVIVAERPWFAELKSTRAESVQSTAYFGSVSHQWIIATARRRVDAEGRFAGAFVLGVPIDALVRQLEREGLAKGAEIALLDKSGQVFASSHWAKFEPDVMSKLVTGSPSFTSLRSIGEEDREIAIVPLADNAFYAILSAPKPPPIALENVSAFGNFALPLLAWLLALVTAWLAMDRLVLRWLDYLRRIALLYASGKLSVQPLRAKRQAPGEINVLADTMEEMAVSLRDRTNRLEAAISARDAAMKEIHHRVKNNLQIINSLLSLQSRKVKDPAAIAVLDDARARINALSLIHRSLYEHNDIRSVEVKPFLSELVMQLDQALGAEDQKIRIESAIDNDMIDADIAVPLALFTAEAVTNSVKHAFPDGQGVIGGRVLVSYRVGEMETLLTVEDDGIGGAAAAEAASTGIGGTLMTAFAKQVHGRLEEAPVAAGGRLVRIRMPRTNGVTGGYPQDPPVHTTALAPAK
jgi:two-component sensor histidine kinase